MQKKVKIEGLDCANCAAALEKELNKIEGVKNLKIDFIKSSLVFESENENKALSDIKHLTKILEPEAKILEEKTSKPKIKRLIFNVSMWTVGIALGLCAILLEESLPVWAFWIIFVLSALFLGYKTYYKALSLLFRGVINENILITLSVIGGAAIGEYMEALMVIALYTIGKILEGLAVDKSRRDIEKLTELAPTFVNILKGDVEEKVLPDEVPVGSIILVRPGEKIPLDGKIIEGKASLDMRSLTGENLPVLAGEGSSVMSGAISLDGALKIKTTSIYSESTVSKVLDLIEHASEKKSKTETLLSKITRWYTLIVVVLAVTVFGVVFAVTKNFNDSLYRGLIFLVISCPCAFAISVPLAYFSGIGNASKKGILIKGSNYLDSCAKLTHIGFDKTGTLTNGEFNVDQIISLKKSLTNDDILYLAAIGEQYSSHPLARSIVALNKRKLKKAKNIKEISGKGVEFEFNNKKYFVGRKAKNTQNTMVEVFEDNKKIGQIVLSDGLKPTSVKACQDLKALGVKTMLLSGDNELAVKKVAETVGVDEYRAKLLPQNKYLWVEEIKKDKKALVGFVGDGINDAPSLMLADVGIAMGITGTDASIEASDIVLVNDDPAKVATAIKISKYTRKIVWENIIVAGIVKVLVLVLGSIGLTGMLLAVFADVGVTLLAVLNSIRALKYTPKN